MLQQILLPLILLIPFTNCLLPKIKSPTLANTINKSCPIIFLMLLTGLFGLDLESRQLLFFESSGIFSFGFIIDDFAGKTLYLLGLVWIIVTIYSDSYLSFTKEENPNLFKILTSLIFAFLNITIVAKNLITILFFANLLFLSAHIFATKFLYQKDSKIAQILTYLIYLESVLLFFATVATYKFTSTIDFNYTTSSLSQVTNNEKTSILLFYLTGLFLAFFAPSYAICRKINLDSFKIYLFFILSLSIFSLYLFIKVIISFFNLSQFSTLISALGFINFELILLFFLIFPAIFVFLSENFKESVFFLTFSQIIFSIFSTLIFLTYHQDKPYLPLASFVLGQTLLFLSISNLSIYLSNSQNSDSKGLFYQLKVTSTLMFFAFLNLCGILPALGMYEKFFIIKTIFSQGLVISGFIFILNLTVLIVFGVKFLIPFVLQPQSKPTKSNIELAKAIDQDSNLMLTTLILALVILILPIIFWFNINLLSL